MSKMILSFNIKIVTLLMLSSAISCSEGARILVVGPYGTKSHQNMFVPLVKELGRHNHQLTVITNYPTTAGPPAHNSNNNIREIVIDQLAVDMSTMISNMFDYVTSPWTLKSLKETIDMMSAGISLFRDKLVDATFDDPQVRHLIANGKFDLILISEASSIFGYPFAVQFKAPYIMLSPNVLFAGRATQLGDDEHFSYVPFLFSSYSDKMTFYQRTMNTIFSSLFNQMVPWSFPIIWSIIQEKRLFNNIPSDYEEMYTNISLILTNTHPSFSYPRTLPPQVIEVGGLHCRPGKPIPKVFFLFPY